MPNPEALSMFSGPVLPALPLCRNLGLFSVESEDDLGYADWVSPLRLDKKREVAGGFSVF